MKGVQLAFLAALLLCNFAEAANLSLGVAHSSAFKGRSVPGFYLSAGSDRFFTSISGHSVYNTYYSQATYHGNLFWGKKTKGLFGKGQWGFGIGGTFSQREADFEEDGTSESKSDFTFGPSIHVSSKIISSVFVGIEVNLGLRSPTRHIVLSFQETVVGVLGLRF